MHLFIFIDIQKYLMLFGRLFWGAQPPYLYRLSLRYHYAEPAGLVIRRIGCHGVTKQPVPCYRVDASSIL